MIMELVCVRYLRNNIFCAVSKHLTRGFQVYKHKGHAVKKRHLISTIDISSSNSCQRTKSTVQLHFRKTHFGRRLFPESSGTAYFPFKSPQTIFIFRHAPVLMQCGYHFHSSGPLRALPAPLIWLVLKPLQKIMAVILGRSIRNWWGSLPPNRQQLMREAVWRCRWQMAAGGVIAMFLMALFLLTHLDESPVTGRTRLLVFSRENYMELAALTAEGYMEEFAELLVPEHDPRHQVVERVVQHLAQKNKDIPELSSVAWSVHVVQNPTVNAFVLPNGKVFMFTGMLDAVADVHQLTFILGHEMAHALLGHSAEQASLSHVVDFLSLILLTAIWAICPRDSLAVLGQWIQGKLVQLMFSRPYSRKLEAEADKVGLQLAAKACADVRAGPVFWQQMEITDQLRGDPVIPEWLSTHPSHRNRVTQLDRLIPQALELRESCDCPALPALDPRAVFSKSISVLLENTKDRGREGTEGTFKPMPLPQNTNIRPGGMATALLAPAVQTSTPHEDLVAPVPVASPTITLANPVPTPAPAEGTGLSSHPRIAGVLEPPAASM
ncbi:metalloendopeptidase OMA1, mitochondrial [Lampris incognitus]|uniref:metalloendopeptidase OMA1, mitochondrial n=1 Tax=Lampris incognitus TaxID=2546036 RepID=UPI0024B5464A|nr:metalloendopeptidase OMA1, mitochondrial [Lampris incognitus]